MIELPDSFWAKTEPLGECIVWKGNRTPKGYGRVYWRGKVVKVHRLAFEAHHGEIPDGFVIDHVCGVKACVRVDHLQALSASDHQRLGHARGELGTDHLPTIQIRKETLRRVFGG